MDAVVALLVLLGIAGAILLGAWWTYIGQPNCAVRKVTDDYAKWKAENDLRREARVAARDKEVNTQQECYRSDLPF